MCSREMDTFKLHNTSKIISNVKDHNWQPLFEAPLKPNTQVSNEPSAIRNKGKLPSQSEYKVEETKQ